MLTLRRGRVTAVVESVEGLSRVEVDGRPCVAYPRLTGSVEVGDEVIVNTQARDLELGSGGFDVLYVNLTRGLDLPADAGVHVVKLPYTPGQSAVRHGEEGRTLPSTLSGIPVVCCSLHSQVAPVCAGIGTDARVAYVQLAGGALPLSLSDTLRLLRQRGHLGTAGAGGGPGARGSRSEPASTVRSSASLPRRHSSGRQRKSSTSSSAGSGRAS